MGQKVNPHVIRLGITQNWASRWFDEKHYKEMVLADYTLRKQLMEKLKMAGVARVDIERSINSLRVILYVSRPGIVIGRGGTGLEDVKKLIVATYAAKVQSKHLPKLDIRVEPVKEPNLESQLVAVNISDQLIKRLPFKRVLNTTAERVMSSGALGVKVVLTMPTFMGMVT